ncbi:MAG: thrombospondin type 3 repeat-containing protein [Patescibacteria group bacterium]|jgi:hypothetical protein|nr:thrombospondin type 3 repeat-containing protein [bacterium]HQC50093.1 thrombospondin type 3 repeat-containing protein [bacterium]
MFQPKTDRKTKLNENEQTANPANPAQANLDQDIIVHNMPNRTRVSKSSYIRSGSNYNANNGGFMKSMGDGAGKSNFKKVGLLIIILGVALIIALFYFGYRFFIKPQAEPTPTPIYSQPTTQLVATSSVETNNEEDETTESNITTDTAETPDMGPISVEVVSPDVYSPENSSTSTSTSPETTSETENSESEEEEVLPVLDSDNDGLTDDEEQALNTNPELADSDDDGHSDLTEILNGYDPLGSGRLADSRFIARHQNSAGNYSVLYPATWDLKSLNNNFTIIISAPDNSLIQISTQDNAKIQNILSWYEETFPDEGNAYERLKQGKNWEGVMGEGGLNFYLTDSNRRNIYVISYIPIIAGRLAYPNIFEMMINSFVVN